MSIGLHILLLLKSFLITRAHPLKTNAGPDTRRDLTDLFGDPFGPNENGATTTLQTYHINTFTFNTFGGTVLSEKTTLKGPVATTAGAMHSIIGKLPNYNITSILSTTVVAGSTGSTASALPVATGSLPEAPTMPPAEATEWKVIGLVVICITFVATVILSVVFFDSWWGFLRDLVFGKRHKDGVENMVPDWDKRSWEFKLANEDGHRYPTITSLDDITEKDNPEGLTAQSIAPYLRTPQRTYSPNHDPHPLDPLARRPSTRPLRSPGTMA